MGNPWPITQRRGWESLVPAPEYYGKKLKSPRQIGLARRFLQANRTDSAPRPYPLYALQHVVRRWAGEHVSRGAVQVALEFEGFAVTLEHGGIVGGVLYAWVSLTPEIHAMLSAFTQGALDHMDGALACVP
jgi:hypothetical protein